MIPWSLLVATTLAQGFTSLTLEVADPQRLAQPPLTAELVTRGASQKLELADDGLPPDEAAGDGVYSVAAATPRTPSAVLHVMDGSQCWENSIRFSDEQTQTIRLTLKTGGQLSVPGDNTTTPSTTSSSTSGAIGAASLAATLPWILAAVGFGAALMLLWRRESSARARPVPGAPPPTGPSGILRVRPGPDGIAGLIAALTRSGQVLVVGPVPPASWPDGTVSALDAPLPRVGAVESAYRALRAEHEHPVVVLTGPVEALTGTDADALQELAELLPGVPLLLPDPLGSLVITQFGEISRAAQDGLPPAEG